MINQRKSMSNLIDGKKISLQIREEIAQEVIKCKKRGILPHLTVILVGEDPASQVYVRSKGKACDQVGISSETLKFPATIKQIELIQTIQRLNRDSKVHGILVQLPLPKHIQETHILESISPTKDVDGIHPVNAGKLALGIEDGFLP